MQLTDPPIGLAAVERFYSPRELVEYPVQCGSRTFHITSHVKARPNIEVFFLEVNARGLAALIHSYDGCFVDRNKRLSNQLSMHGRGAAFDINAGSNAQGATPTMPLPIIHLAHELGFFWGGDFAGRYVDGMHFQLGVDFPLNGRPVPHVTYQAEKAGLVAPVASVKPTPMKVSDIKVFEQDGTPVFRLERPALVRIESGVLIGVEA